MTLVESHEARTAPRIQANDVVEIVARRRRQGRSRQAERRGRRDARLCRRWARDVGGARRISQLRAGRRRRPCRGTSFSCASGRESKAHISGVALLTAAQHADTRCGRPCRAPLREPRDVQDRARRRSDRRVPGQDHRAPARPEDGRAHDEPGGAAVGGRHHEQQAGTRDLRRRRAVRPRRDVRRSSTTTAVLPHGPRPAAKRSREPLVQAFLGEAVDSSRTRRRARR